MYPGTWAASTPDKPALIIAETGQTTTYAELEDRSLRLAHVFADAGLVTGDVVALISDNAPQAYEVYWAALRSGLYVTAVNHHLSADEAAYIVNDCGAKAMVVSGAKTELVEAMAEKITVPVRLAFGGAVPGCTSYDEALSTASTEPLADQPHGDDFLYSSGTTGRPKGIKLPLLPIQVDEPGYPYVMIFGALFSYGPDTVYLSPAPVYHAAPLRYTGVIQALGGTVVLMQRFEPEAFLRAVQEYSVTDTQCVPTMFVRMLKLPDEVRASYDTSSLKTVVHAAAPCPVEVKQQMMEWLGPIVHEYYASTEANGATYVGPEDWLAHPGTVGTVAARDPAGVRPDRRRAAGRAGRHDLLRARRRAVHLPRRPGEDRVHPAPRAPVLVDGRRPRLRRRRGLPVPHRPQGVHDHQRRGEHLSAGDRGPVQPAPVGARHRRDRGARRGHGRAGGGVRRARRRSGASADLAAELTAYARERIAHFKVPSEFIVTDDLPRTPTGKLVKGKLRERYAGASA